MNRFIKYFANVHRLALLAVVLLVCMVVLVGAVWARYQERITQRMNYIADEVGTTYLWSAINEDGTFEEAASEWIVSGSKRTLDFYVSNGMDEVTALANGIAVSAYPEQQVVIRLVASSSIQNGDSMDVVLHVSDISTGEPVDVTATHLATAREISENSLLAATFGGGWAYIFCDTEGNELLWTLEGGKLSVLQAQLVLDQMDLLDMGLIELQVSAR